MTAQVHTHLTEDLRAVTERTPVVVTAEELTHLFRSSSRGRPVECEWGTGKVLVGPNDQWISDELLRLREE